MKRPKLYLPERLETMEKTTPEPIVWPCSCGAGDHDETDHDAYDAEYGIDEHATVAFYPDASKGAWYEVGKGDTVGALYAPMHTDGSMDPAEVGEVEVTYEDA